MHISYKPLWHTLVERNMRKEDLRLAAGLTTNMIANMGISTFWRNSFRMIRMPGNRNKQLYDIYRRLGRIGGNI